MNASKKMFSHDRVVNTKEEWLTPPYIIESCGEFDLDPCAPVRRPWDTAKLHYTILDDGLSKDWRGFVWCNPPYGRKAGLWLKRMASHGNGIALIFARTETAVFFDYIWNGATALLFIKGRLNFHHVTGERGDSAGAPSVLVAYGDEAARRLGVCGIPGRLVML